MSRGLIVILSNKDYIDQCTDLYFLNEGVRYVGLRLKDGTAWVQGLLV